MSSETKLGLSLLLNVVLALALLGAVAADCLEGQLEAKGGPMVVLKEDTPVHCFSKKRTLFTLPKGLVLQDVSAHGASIFEPHRYKLIITTDLREQVRSVRDEERGVCGDSYFYSCMRPWPQDSRADGGAQ